jgi:hypothetical protein
MPLLRPNIALFARRAALLSFRHTLAARPISSTAGRFAQGYGDGEGDPKGEKSQHQGSSNSTKHNAEHPGPEPPSEGQGSGAGPSKGRAGKSPEDSSAQSGGARSKDAKETGSSPTGGSIGKGGGKDNSQGSPKIQSRSQPGDGNTESKQAEVEKHNREFEQRHDRAPKAAADKVDKKFWSGKC